MATIVASSSFVAAGVGAPPRSGQSSRSVVRSAAGRIAPRRHGLVVRCQRKLGQGETPKSKVSTKFSDVLAFSGPAPERINGRLAMIGFVSAIAVEAASGAGLFSQIDNGGVAWFVGTAVLFSVASLVPLFKGESVEAETDGVMNANAELWNGRFAMLGLVALACTEYLKGGPLV